MPKVLIIGPKFHYFNSSVERAFGALGYDTRVNTFDNPVHPYNWCNKIRYRFCSDKQQMKRECRDLWQPEINKAFDAYCPDIVFIMNGDMLAADTLRRWRSCGARIVLWFFDSFTHIPLCEDNIPVVDRVFCYEQTDIPLIREKYGVEAHFLPQAVDMELYHPLNVEKKQYDIVFAGDIFHSRKRRELIQAVVAHYPNLKIRVWGEYKPWYKNPWIWLTREHRDVYMNCNATAEQLNLDYNRARIVLNVHIEQQKDGANPKVYEIAASGSYQVCDANPYVQQLFPNGEIGLYHDKSELFALIDEALANDMSHKAKAAQLIVQGNHTFVQRIRQCIETLG